MADVRLYITWRGQRQVQVWVSVDAIFAAEVN